MATLYERFLLPKLLKCACSAPPILKQREKVVPKAEGRVLELGIGMGLNLPLYDVGKVESVTGVDPAPELRRIAEAAPRDPRLAVRVENGTAEALPFDDASFDCIVCTFTLCSVQTPAKALSEARRVLKPGGRFLYCEHGLSPDEDVAKWQRRIEPVWKRLCGGCHLTRPVTRAVEQAGFRVERSDAMYLPRAPRFAGWSEWGEASGN
ncbi:class I SAM-dependent methyltransferase [Phenylobacterium sp.]|uniref:class I SAM-dependent methyltransferase n=1 Tax=Phenylobacterium sp. TaxID=1871053 RepID=UPI0025D736F4|nr:class I SAM-dependent methyltransferase [Phenylobacterium sp.]MBX3482568.1 class I SAM-dependent methyltransferase [Phenylobacterium sp.]MCW5760247.1 class I SAM-dependent methyltransferase [Phenylobacterium sp.]